MLQGISPDPLMNLKTVGSDGFNPIPIDDILGQILIKGGDFAQALLQAALADTNDNNIFDTSEEYNDFCDRLEENSDTSYTEIDYSWAN